MLDPQTFFALTLPAADDGQCWAVEPDNPADSRPTYHRCPNESVSIIRQTGAEFCMTHMQEVLQLAEYYGIRGTIT